MKCLWVPKTEATLYTPLNRYWNALSQESCRTQFSSWLGCPINFGQFFSPPTLLYNSHPCCPHEPNVSIIIFVFSIFAFSNAFICCEIETKVKVDWGNSFFLPNRLKVKLLRCLVTLKRLFWYFESNSKFVGVPFSVILCLLIVIHCILGLNAYFKINL